MEATMKSLCTSLVVISLLAVATLAQPNPDTLWTWIYDGGGDDYASCIQQTTDGGYIVAGQKGVHLCLIKMNGQGDTIWTRVCGWYFESHASSVQQTADGGYMVAGYADVLALPEWDFYLVKTDSLGDTLWTRTYGGTGFAYSAQPTCDGGYIMAGDAWPFASDFADFCLVKTNSDGDTLWMRTYGGNDWEEAYSAQQTTDSGYIAAGWTNSFGAGNEDFYLVKTNGQGDTLWTRTYGGSGTDRAFSVQQTADGGYVSVGWTNSFDAGPPPYEAIYLVRTDGQGDTLWTRTYGGNRGDDAYSVQQTADGGFIIAGSSYSFGAGWYDFYLVRTNSEGDTLWTRTYGGDDRDVALSIQQTSDGGYVMAGITSSFGPGVPSFSNMYVVKTGPEESGTEMSTIGVPSQYILYPAFPNPFNPSAQITFALPKTEIISLKIFNLMGQEVVTLADGMQSAGTHVVSFDGSALPSGIYFYRLQAGSFVQTHKMVLLK
jgi:hypothetical protein